MRKVLFFVCFAILIIAIHSHLVSPVLTPLVGIGLSTSIVAVLEKESQGLFVSFLVAIYLEHIQSKILKDNKSNNNKMESIMVDFVSKLDARAIIVRLLEDRFNKYINKGSIIDLVDMVLPLREIYYDVKVNYCIENENHDDKKYKIKYSMAFKANLSEYVVAITKSGFIQELISSGCSKISDAIAINTMYKGEKYLEEIIRSTVIKKNIKDAFGKTFETRLPISIIKDKDFSKYLPGIPHSKYKDIILIKTSFENYDNKIYSYSISMPNLICDKTDHFVYWIADRPMWIDSINIDAVGFSYNGQQNFSVQPILMNYVDRDSPLCSEKGMSLKVESWVAKGHGVIFSWR